MAGGFPSGSPVFVSQRWRMFRHAAGRTIKIKPRKRVCWRGSPAYCNWKGQLVLLSTFTVVDAVVGFSNGQADARLDKAATAIRLANTAATSFFMQTPLPIIPI